MGILDYILAAVAAIIAIAFGAQKMKATRATKRADKAEEERDKLKVVAEVQKQADQIKDDLVVRQHGNEGELKEVIQSISEIPEEKEVPLSEDVKKHAADQFDRLRSRADRM